MTDAPRTDEKSTFLFKFLSFSPILTGATLKERMIGCLGALIGICVTAVICSYVFGDNALLPLIVAPIGASAVLLFAVPASPLAQPWPIIGGNTISALVGITVSQFVHDPMLAVGLAVSLAIAVMSFTRSLHPPGGAAALTAVIGGPAVASAGYMFPFIPVGINSVILVLLGIIFHRISRRRYPHAAAPPAVNTHDTADIPAALRVGFNGRDVDAAILEFHETLDIDRADIDRLLRSVEQHSLVRTRSKLLCRDIMSRDVVCIGHRETAQVARRLLLEHDIRTLPVLDDVRRLIGTVGLRELVMSEGIDGRLPFSEAETAIESDAAVSLIPKLTDGSTHAVVIVDAAIHVTGIISQTDLLAAVANSLAVSHDNAA